MDAIALDNASPMRPVCGSVEPEVEVDAERNLLDNARWLLASIPTAASLFGAADDEHSGTTDKKEGTKHAEKESADLLAIPAAATPRREGQDPRVATRHFPSPWLRQQQEQMAPASPADLGSALSRAKQRAKSPVAQQRARSVLQNITNSSSARSSPFKRAAANSTKRTPLKSRSSGVPRDENKATAQETNDNAEKQAKLEALKAELKLLQLFSEKKSGAIRDGDPNSVRVSFGSIQTRPAGGKEWSDAEPTVVIVEVPADSAQNASTVSPSCQPPSSPVVRNRSPGVLRPSSPRAQAIELENAKKEEELAKLKVELALLTQRKAATSRQKRVMEANHLWFGDQSTDAAQQQQEQQEQQEQAQQEQQQRQQQRQQQQQQTLPPVVRGDTCSTSTPTYTSRVDDTEDPEELALAKLQERSAQRAAELEAARAELATLNAQLRQSGKVLHGTGVVKLEEMMDSASVSSGVVRPSPHKGCETVLISSRAL